MTTYRSLLPHEPLPDETEGYLHIQGAFSPRKKKNEDGDQTELADRLKDWNQESLEESLLASLQANHSTFGLPFPTKSILILDKTFSKVRLVYATALQAFHTFVAFRRLKLNPQQLFQSDAFGTRPLQVTPVTQQPIATGGWERSNPPKFRRLVPRPDDNPEVLQEERETTRFVFVSNLLAEGQAEEPAFWSDPSVVAEAIRSNFPDAEVFVNYKHLGKYCHIGFRTALDARQAIAKYQEQTVAWKWYDENESLHTAQSGALFLDHAAPTQRRRRRLPDEAPGEPPRSECTSATAHVQVPGLVLVPDFVSPSEEAALLAVLTGPHAPWAPAQDTPTHGGSVKRFVQHYGYVFDYKTADVLRDRSKAGADCPAMPTMAGNSEDFEAQTSQCVAEGRGWEVLAGVVERTRRHEFADVGSFSGLNQMTVNRYAPGEGIGSHVDTPPAFGDGLISLSIGSGIVMEFQEVPKDSNNSKNRKLVYLPARSLLLMSGPARYEWEHMIVSRMTDTHNDEVLRRGTRISLTLRTALNSEGGTMPLVESYSFPPVWGTYSDASPLATPDCERNHVHAVYDAIATQWHHTRGRRGVLWPGATQFLQRLPIGSLVADVGCGDGKYFPAIWEAGSYVIGTDISRPLLVAAKSSSTQNEDQVAESRRVSESRHHLRNRPAIAVADCMNVPLRSKSCDAAICIAVMHHLSTESRRRRCIEELVRIVRPGGLINIQAWAMDQDSGSRRQFASNDVYVPFNAQPRHLTMNGQPLATKTKEEQKGAKLAEAGASPAEVYSKVHNAEYDEKKGLVVFKRYCHLYRKGELDEIASSFAEAEIVESGFESGNYFIILKVLE